ncbi:Major facilitator superfamily domain, general substrate transporter [Pseudocohnilembus persalinus]|uniref:Major facilitator superfamily domain, general substrate transporter n=1 Tax=Pseudocohnilembus persalinus TaxID=266149 RepID=A0A0V0QB58_PSEPJ|nr:Major facilitator superfamily domain, general substrate transporter [Pseudocohnilembus persalinus]|eukprot:KRW99459.1 Major facilitator superfamily domain, general substrate transporter [Pseudocohnilembus persalinus]
MGSLYLSMIQSMLNPCFKAIKVKYNVDDSNDSEIYAILTSSQFIGGIIGLVLMTPIYNYFQNLRKIAIMSDILAIIICALQLYSNVYVFLITRILNGFLCGLNSVMVPQFIKEISPIKLLGQSGTFYGLSLSCGTISIFTLSLTFNSGSEISDEKLVSLFNFYLCFPAIFVFIRLIFFLFFYKFDTPLRALLRKDQIQTQKNILLFYNDQNSKIVFDDYDKEAKLKEKEKNFSYKQIFKNPSSFNKTVICMVAMSSTAQNGTNIISFYSNTIFEEATNNDFQSTLLSILVSAVGICMILISGKIIKNYGRKQLIMRSGFTDFLLMLALIILSIFQNQVNDKIIPWSIIGVIFIHRSVTSLGFQPQIFSYIGDILYGKEMQLAQQSYWISNFIITLAFPLMSFTMAFSILAVIFFVSLMYLKKKMLESKGLCSQPTDCNLITENEENSNQQKKIKIQEKQIDIIVVKDVQHNKLEKAESNRSTEGPVSENLDQ